MAAPVQRVVEHRLVELEEGLEQTVRWRCSCGEHGMFVPALVGDGKVVHEARVWAEGAHFYHANGLRY